MKNKENAWEVEEYLALTSLGGHLCFQLLDFDGHDVADGISDLALLVAENLNLLHLLGDEVHLPLEVVLGAFAVLLDVVSGADIHNHIVDVFDSSGNVHRSSEWDEAGFVVPVILELFQRLLASAVLPLCHLQRVEGVLEDRKLLK